MLETLIRQATSLRGKTGTVTITARLFPHPRHGTECFDFSIGIKKRSLSDYEKKKIFSKVVDSTIKYERVGLLFTLEQVLTGILISFRGGPFALLGWTVSRSLRKPAKFHEQTNGHCQKQRPVFFIKEYPHENLSLRFFLDFLKRVHEAFRGKRRSVYHGEISESIDFFPSRPPKCPPQTAFAYTDSSVLRLFAGRHFCHYAIPASVSRYMLRSGRNT